MSNKVMLLSWSGVMFIQQKADVNIHRPLVLPMRKRLTFVWIGSVMLKRRRDGRPMRHQRQLGGVVRGRRVDRHF